MDSEKLVVNKRTYFIGCGRFSYELEKTEKFMDYLFSHPTTEKFLSILNNHPSKPITILDISCGAGNEIIRFKDLYPKAITVGMDLCEQLVEIKKNKPSVDFVQGNLDNPPLIGNYWCGILCKDTMVHFPDMEIFIKNINNLLAPGGGCLLIWNPTDNNQDYSYSINRVDLRKTILNQGLTIREESESWYPPSDDWYRINRQRTLMLIQKPKY